MKAESSNIPCIELIEPAHCGDERCFIVDGAPRHGGIARDGKVET